LGGQTRLRAAIGVQNVRRTAVPLQSTLGVVASWGMTHLSCLLSTLTPSQKNALRLYVQSERGLHDLVLALRPDLAERIYERRNTPTFLTVRDSL
jgi:hypothetical protein